MQQSNTPTAYQIISPIFPPIVRSSSSTIQVKVMGCGDGVGGGLGGGLVDLVASDTTVAADCAASAGGLRGSLWGICNPGGTLEVGLRCG
jgi:hypothetical protein